MDESLIHNQLHNWWNTEQNENMDSLAHILLRISKQWEQSIKTSAKAFKVQDPTGLHQPHACEAGPVQNNYPEWRKTDTKGT